MYLYIYRVVLLTLACSSKFIVSSLPLPDSFILLLSSSLRFLISSVDSFFLSFLRLLLFFFFFCSLCCLLLSLSLLFFDFFLSPFVLLRFSLAVRTGVQSALIFSPREGFLFDFVVVVVVLVLLLPAFFQNDFFIYWETTHYNRVSLLCGSVICRRPGHVFVISCRWRLFIYYYY